MKKFFIMIAASALAISASAQKTITLSKEQSGADEIITNFWNNDKAPHSNEETRDEQINERLHFTRTSQTETCSRTCSGGCSRRQRCRGSGLLARLCGRVAR